MQIQPANYMDGEGTAINLTLDVPVTVPTGVTALPSGGGEAGKSFEKCRNDLAAKNLEGARSDCFDPGDNRFSLPETTEGFQDHEFYGDDSLTAKSMKITGGRTKGDWAELYVQTENEGQKQQGSVFMKRTPQGWRYDHQVLQEVY